MKKKILSMGVFLLLIVTVMPAVASFKNSTITSTVPSTSLTIMGVNRKTQNPTNIIESDASNQIPINNYEALTDNVPPDKPTTPIGRTQGKPGVSYAYTTSTIDSDEDMVYYKWNWGDGNISGWLGPYASGVTISTNHTWTVKGSFNITVKAKDTHRLESWWSDPLPIAMPHTYDKPILQFLELLFQRFPNAFPILRHLMGY
jgi:hypothetical protein